MMMFATRQACSAHRKVHKRMADMIRNGEIWCRKKETESEALLHFVCDSPHLNVRTYVSVSSFGGFLRIVCRFSTH